MKAISITKNNFDEIKERGKVLVDFYADWCGPCRALAPVIEEIAEERDDVTVGKINVDNEQELASRFGVFSIPTLVVLEGGKEVRRLVGSRPKAKLIEFLEG